MRIDVGGSSGRLMVEQAECGPGCGAGEARPRGENGEDLREWVRDDGRGSKELARTQVEMK